MSELDRLLDTYAPPPIPAGLAERVAAAVITAPRERWRLGGWARRGSRGSWRRGTLICGAVTGLALTSAVAAEVVSDGRLEIPVVHQVVQAIPALHRAPPKPHAVQVASRAVTPASKPPTAEKPEVPAVPRERALQRFAEVQRKVAERRAAGLPTPNADRIDRKAQQMVDRRAAAGLAVPSLAEAELRVAMREWRTTRLLRQVARDPSNLSDAQVQRFAQILPPAKRAQFVALEPEQQRLLMGRTAQRFLERRMQQRAQAVDATAPGATDAASEESNAEQR